MPWAAPTTSPSTIWRGTDVTEVNIDLAGVPGTALATAQPDTVTINATSGNDVITIVGDAGGISILGLAAQVNIAGFETTSTTS